MGPTWTIENSDSMEYHGKFEKLVTKINYSKCKYSFICIYNFVCKCIRGNTFDFGDSGFSSHAEYKRVSYSM